MRLIFDEMKKCSKCKELKSFSLFYKGKIFKDGYRPSCKKCDSLSRDIEKRDKYNKDYWLKNKERLSKRNKEYRKKNKESLAKYQSEYSKKWYQENKQRINKRNRERKKTDILYRLRRDISTYTSRALKKRGYTKKSKTHEIIGIDYYGLKIHLENQFTTGMNWDNRSEWHIDHIVQLSSANTEEELIRLCHYTNLQPLWAEDNLKKGGKLSD